MGDAEFSFDLSSSVVGFALWSWWKWARKVRKSWHLPNVPAVTHGPA